MRSGRMKYGHSVLLGSMSLLSVAIDCSSNRVGNPYTIFALCCVAKSCEASSALGSQALCAMAFPVELGTGKGLPPKGFGSTEHGGVSSHFALSKLAIWGRFSLQLKGVHARNDILDCHVFRKHCNGFREEAERAVCEFGVR